jgi:hypothetical protein
LNDGAEDPGSRTHLESLGFEGFLRVGELHADGCRAVPNEPGVYAIVRESTDAPKFLGRSEAPEWRGMNPTRPVVELEERWVAGAQLLFVAAAPGPGVRNLLRQRVKRMLRFGSGAVVGHWGGRLVWQLADHRSLRVSWKVTEAPVDAMNGLVQSFERAHGAMPFANEPAAADAESEDADS